ncbi:MAG: VOC family protein [Acidobacteriota bacterium]
MIKKVAFVSHPTSDMDQARKFFGETLGLKQSASYEDAWVEFQAPDGTTIALDTFSPKQDPKASVYLALETDDIRAEVDRLREAGVDVLLDVMDNKQEDGTEVCKMAIVRAPDGHPLMLHEIAPHRS